MNLRVQIVTNPDDADFVFRPTSKVDEFECVKSRHGSLARGRDMFLGFVLTGQSTSVCVVSNPYASGE